MYKTTIKILILTWALVLPAAVWAQTPGSNKISIGFRATVDHLRLRATANKTAAVVAELPEHTQLIYLDQTAGNWDEVTLRNQAHTARWYKVSTADISQKTGWVYGGAVMPSSVYISTESDPKVPVLHYDFMDLEPITQQQYQTVSLQYHNPVRYDTTLYRTNDSTLLLPINTGKPYTLVSEGQEENRKEYSYEGQLPDIQTYLVTANYYEYGEILIIDQKTGRQTATLGYPGELPQLSPDKQWLALGWSDIYESNGGLQVLAVLPDGVYTATLITIENMYFEGVCWDTQGRIYFCSYHWDDTGNQKVYQYHRLTFPKR